MIKSNPTFNIMKEHTIVQKHYIEGVFL